jgi:hypothetical protein
MSPAVSSKLSSHISLNIENAARSSIYRVSLCSPLSILIFKTTDLAKLKYIYILEYYKYVCIKNKSKICFNTFKENYK